VASATGNAAGAVAFVWYAVERSTKAMNTRVNRLLFAAALALLSTSLPPPAGAASPGSDLRYCEALSQLYMRYIGNPETEPRKIRRNDAVADKALAQCRQGDAAAAIPVLERKLTDNGFTLPRRD
jgi:hypothetical protein